MFGPRNVSFRIPKTYLTLREQKVTLICPCFPTKKILRVRYQHCKKSIPLQCYFIGSQLIAIPIGRQTNSKDYKHRSAESAMQK